jgi:hypothetical protein
MPDNTDPNFQSFLATANQLRQHGRYVDAWESLENLEPIGMVEPETLALRLQLCAGLARIINQW